MIMDKGSRLIEAHKNKLNYVFTMEDVKYVLDDIPCNKAPGMDGFGSLFFKLSWVTLKHYVHADVSYFFLTGKIPKKVNVTSITLVPKVSVPATVGDFRPIACCLVIYKCISNLLCEKLNYVLPNIISPNQGAF